MTEPLDLLPGHKHGLLLASPILAAAGSFGYAGADACAGRPPYLGAVVTRSLTRHPQRPAPLPRFVETPAGLVHRLHVGNIGFGAATRRGRYGGPGGWGGSAIPVLVSLAGTAADCAYMAGRLDETSGSESGLDLVSGVELRLWTLSGDEVLDEAVAVVAAVREATTLPVLVKLSPAEPGLVSLACECVEAGADVLVVGGPWPAMAPPAEGDAPWAGWLSGPALLPLVLPRVRQVAEAVSVPVIGCGGVRSPADVQAYLRAGARAVQVGSAFLVMSEP